MSERHVTDQWIDRVRAADAEAEARYGAAVEVADDFPVADMAVLLAIAAELRAARIARRPGAGQ